MKYFKKIEGLPTFDLYSEFVKILENPAFPHNEAANSWSITTVPERPDDVYFGCGSLTHDWDNSYEDEHGNLIVPELLRPVKEEDFTEIVTIFKDTLFETVLDELRKRYKIGRVRIMRSLPKTCLSWHKDTEKRIHYPMLTNTGCFMVIDDEVFHIPQNEWWETDTLPKHTAFNGSMNVRYHLVGCIIE